MASSNTANWRVYSRKGKADIEGLLWWFDGPKYPHLHWVPPECTWLPQVISKPDNYSSGTNWHIKVKSENYCQKHPEAGAERGKVAFDWPQCPSFNLSPTLPCSIHTASRTLTSGRLTNSVCGDVFWRKYAFSPTRRLVASVIIVQ